MKIGLALPHLGLDATKENIIKLAVDAKKEIGVEHIIFAFVGLGLDKWLARQNNLVNFLDKKGKDN